MIKVDDLLMNRNVEGNPYLSDFAEFVGDKIEWKVVSKMYDRFCEVVKFMDKNGNLDRI